MTGLPSLDAHAHLYPANVSDSDDVGAVLGMTLSLVEAQKSLGETRGMIAWGVGCHPRRINAQEAFDADQFSELAKKTAIIGEIGLDFGEGYRVASPDLQLRNFRAALDAARGLNRIVSIHSYRSTGAILKELERIPVEAPILHWWTGTAAETRKAVEIGCYFSVHSAVARQSKFRVHAPLERILVETDHGYLDPVLGIPPRIEWVEHLVAQQYKVTQPRLREIAWSNFASLIEKTGTMSLLPDGVRRTLHKASAC